MISSELFDIAIIGAGPAGSAAAITSARSGLKVLLMEGGTFPRQRVCGEFLSAESLQLLSALTNYDKRLAESVDIFNFELHLDGRIRRGRISPVARGISRFNLDQLLWQCAGRSGATLCDRTRVTRIDGQGPFTLATSSGEYSATAVINCSGRWSALTGVLPVVQGPKWIGVKAHFCEAECPPQVDLYYFSGGYCGVQPISADEVNVCAMVRSDVATDLTDVFRCHPELAARSACWRQTSETVSTSPLLFQRPVPLFGNILAAGDAAGFIDPFLGDGISLALHTGVTAANCLVPVFSEGQPLEHAAARYAQDYERHIAPLFAKAARLRRLLSLPKAVRIPALEVMRIPGISEWLIQKTRPAIQLRSANH
jgi:menaquinone-9 beta-reductase